MPDVRDSLGPCTEKTCGAPAEAVAYGIPGGPFAYCIDHAERAVLVYAALGVRVRLSIPLGDDLPPGFALGQGGNHD